MDLDKDWAEKLVIPVRFSTSTNKVLDTLETGYLTKKARVEIVHMCTHPGPLLMTGMLETSREAYNSAGQSGQWLCKLKSM